MQALLDALAMLAHIEANFHSFANPEGVKSDALAEVVKQCASSLQAINARLSSIEGQVNAISHAPAVESDVFTAPPVAEPVAEAPAEPVAEIAPAEPAPVQVETAAPAAEAPVEDAPPQ